ncbi:MAG: Asp-tRNA(Asn)/Glu-tRNA(Gln) amidotransferase subunit GatA [Anaerolineae bacterium]|nr:Asp-tRNA(Asn)/Glu-tRNA(Gln) amidotransferase subunit GatA [Anaerolineae bacterium]
MTLTDLSVTEIAEGLRRRAFSSVEVTQAFLERIARVNPTIHAYLSTDPEHSLALAREADSRLAEGREGQPLLGVPLAIKDVICTDDFPTTCGSRMLEGYRSPFEATAVRRLREAGAVLLGKTNTDEYAMGSSTENSAFGPTHNPWDAERVPGGSSGGSAAAVAARCAPGALGSDTGGSVRQPASFCGVPGIKPTYGRVSRWGLVAFASSLDQIGAFGRTSRDCALLLNAICGHDRRDSTSSMEPVPDFTAALTGEIRGLRVGVPREYFIPGMQPEVEAAVRSAVAELERMGAQVGEVSLPHTEYALPAYYIVADAEASANLARYDGIRYGYYEEAPSQIESALNPMWEAYSHTRGHGLGPEVKRRIMLGTYVLSAGYYEAYYLKAQKVRTLIRGDFDRAFEHYDVLVSPTAPTVAFRLGEKVASPLQMYLADVFTLALSLAGLPGMSVPCGFADGMPVGLQIMGRQYDEVTILRLADAFERVTDWHRRHPPI